MMAATEPMKKLRHAQKIQNDELDAVCLPESDRPVSSRLECSAATSGGGGAHEGAGEQAPGEDRRADDGERPAPAERRVDRQRGHRAQDDRAHPESHDEEPGREAGAVAEPGERVRRPARVGKPHAEAAQAAVEQVEVPGLRDEAAAREAGHDAGAPQQEDAA